MCLQVDDNIPLRVMLLLMDEVFDLKEKNQWLRRNIKNLLQQLIRATYGDTINRSVVLKTHRVIINNIIFIKSAPLTLPLSDEGKSWIMWTIWHHQSKWQNMLKSSGELPTLLLQNCLISLRNLDELWLFSSLFRDSYWPNGILAETPPRRDKCIRMRTRIAAKTSLLGIMPGENTPYLVSNWLHIELHHNRNLFVFL